jgi:hypothetical protein
VTFDIDRIWALLRTTASVQWLRLALLNGPHPSKNFSSLALVDRKEFSFCNAKIVKLKLNRLGLAVTF